MSPPPRRLTFAVGTSLLTTTLSLGAGGCTDKTTSNPGPEPEPLNVNEGPEPQPQPEPGSDGQPV
ncbi:MAG: hypothetical protein KC457_34400, partial [Myxococcales bacterium]|nr:hypothetical protein [Myxococcales bacterium]